jgi:hypothetical protein
MHATLTAPSNQLVSSEEVDRFRQVVEIHDEQRFRQMLNELLASKAGNEPYRPPTPEEKQALLERLRTRPDAGPVDKWTPSQTQIQRGRVNALQEFNQAHNVPLPRYAELAHLSRQHLYKLIKERKLLALKGGSRGYRIPDWQLAPLPARLTREVLQRAPIVNEWTIYDWLRLPHERFGGKAPIDSVTLVNFDKLVDSLMGALGIED